MGKMIAGPPMHREKLIKNLELFEEDREPFLLKCFISLDKNKRVT